MLLDKKIRVAAVLLISIFITSCAGILTEVKQENRDTASTYDGTWKVEVLKSAGSQFNGNWVLNCPDMRRTFNMRVNDGTISLGNTSSYVSADGIFKLIHPISSEASATGSSSTTMANGDMKLILTGKLVPDGERSKGHITYGIAEIGYDGCTAKTKYTLTNQTT